MLHHVQVECGDTQTRYCTTLFATSSLLSRTAVSTHLRRVRYSLFLFSVGIVDEGRFLERCAHSEDNCDWPTHTIRTSATTWRPATKGTKIDGQKDEGTLTASRLIVICEIDDGLGVGSLLPLLPPVIGVDALLTVSQKAVKKLLQSVCKFRANDRLYPTRRIPYNPLENTSSVARETE